MAKTQTTTKNIIGANIKALRRQQGLTQQKVAEALDITWQAYQRYETGLNAVPFARMISLARIFKVPIEFIYNGVETYAPPSKHRDTLALRCKSLKESYIEVLCAMANALYEAQLSTQVQGRVDGNK